MNLLKRLQAKEQEELTIEEKSKLFVQLLEARKKHFVAKRAEEKRNRPPTKAQQRSIMYTYLKNMVGWNPKDLKNKSFTNIQELFDKAMKRGLLRSFDKGRIRNLWKLVKAKQWAIQARRGYKEFCEGKLEGFQPDETGRLLALRVLCRTLDSAGPLHDPVNDRVIYKNAGLEVGWIRRIQVLDTAYWGFLRVGTTLDIFQNIILIPYLEYGVLILSRYGVLIFIPLWSLVSAGTDTPYLP
ncbi:hypothetical protein Tco_1276357 [Tanacetum coccineum]